MKNNRVFFSKTVFVVLITAIIGASCIIFIINQFKPETTNISSLPIVQAPLVDIPETIRNKGFECQISEIIVQRIRIEPVEGQLFAICSYNLNNQRKDVALLLAYNNTQTSKSYFHGEGMGEYGGIFDKLAFERSIEKSGFKPGSFVRVAISDVDGRNTDEAIYQIKFMGELIKTHYSPNKLENFFLTANPQKIPTIAKIKSVPILVPVDVTLK